MIDPLKISTEDIHSFSENFGLKKLPKLDNDAYFIKRRLLKYYLNSSNKIVKEICQGVLKVQIITGLGITGDLQLGNKLILNEVNYFLQSGSKVELFLSLSDALTKNLDKITTKKYTDNLYKYVGLNLSDNNNLTIHIDENFRKVELFNKINSMITDVDFLRIYGEDLNNDIKAAIIDMTTSILSSENTSRTVVLLGIDEFFNALFITEVSKRLKLKLPIFLFNIMILGYDGKKMGKSRPSNSLIITNNSSLEIEKISKHLCKSKICRRDCPAHQLVRFSEYADLPQLGKLSMHKKILEIIKRECVS